MENERNMRQETNEKRKTWRGAWKRWLIIAAVLVFLVGGTLATRDSLNPARKVLRESVVYTAEPLYGSGARMSGASTDSAPTVFMEEAAMDVADAAAGAMDNGSTVGGVTSGKMIIRTVTITLGTRTYESTLNLLKDQCAAMGGWVEYSSENASSGSSLRRASMTLRIPAEKLDAYLDAVADGGRLISRTESAADVTEAYTDTKNRLASQQALMDRLLALTGEADSLGDLLELESKIADTQYELDRLQKSLNSTERQVTYATVELSLREENDKDTAEVKELTLGERMVAAARQGWENFRSFMEDMAVFLVSALPLLLTLALAVTVITLIVKKSRKRREQKAGTEKPEN